MFVEGPQALRLDLLDTALEGIEVVRRRKEVGWWQSEEAEFGLRDAAFVVGGVQRKLLDHEFIQHSLVLGLQLFPAELNLLEKLLELLHAVAVLPRQHHAAVGQVRRARCSLIALGVLVCGL